MAPLSDARSAAVSPRAIAFVGFMGAGKTRAARGAGSVLGERVTDVDAELESKLGEPIPDYFDRVGEAEFRRHEEPATLAALERGGIVSLGGGAIEIPAVREALAGPGVFTVWCRISEQTAWERCMDSGRPLARDRDSFAARLAKRGPLYESVADAVLDHGGERTGRLAAHWLRAAAGLPGTRLAWAASTSGSYPALVGPGVTGLVGAGADPALFAGATGRTPGRWFGICDATAMAAQPALVPGLELSIEVAGGEGSKHLSEVERVLRGLAAAGARRDDGIVAFGGGVIGDLAGFCAATYQRGVPVVQIPTTLVAQVDSAYGGKTGVDLPEAKNYVGAYHLPSAVLADPGALATLPARELAAGFTEIVKTGLIAGGILWDRVRAADPRDPASLGELVFDCARTKIDVVAADERDGGIRASLNLGHTIGHAIEAVTGYGRYLHGEAVALGLLAALRLSGADELRDEVRELLRAGGLPTAIEPPLDPGAIVAATKLDKKATAAGVGYVFVSEPGAIEIEQHPSEDAVSAAVSELLAA